MIKVKNGFLSFPSKCKNMMKRLMFCILSYLYNIIKITCLELNTNFEWNNKIRATLQNKISSRKQKLNKSKQKSNNGEDVYTLFQSIWCHKLRFFGSFEDWVLFLAHTNTHFSNFEYFVKMQAINRFISRNISMVIFVFYRIRHFSK